MMYVRRLLQTTSLVLGTGYVLFFFSERLFWSLIRPGDSIAIFGATWLVYAFVAYLLLATVRLYRVRDFWALFLAGALFGWLVEGVYAMTMFGDDSLPFPLTIAWTGLAWHAPISVVFGFYGLRRALQAGSIWPGMWLSLLVGSFWGFWALGWGLETPPLVADAAMFFTHALAATCVLGFSQLLIGWGDPAGFRPSWPGLISAASVIVAFFAFVTVPAIPWSPLILLPLLGLIFFALRRNRVREHHYDALAELAAPVPLLHLVGLAGIPVAATIIYAGCNAVGFLPPSHQIVCAVTTIAGFVLFAIAVFKLSTRGRQGPEPLDGRLVQYQSQ
jgi:hypothetical protein